MLLIFGVMETAYGQIKSKNTTVEWGPELRTGYKIHLDDIITNDATGFYLLKSKKETGEEDEYYIEHFGYDMQPDMSVYLDMGEGKYTREFEFVTGFEGRLYVFSTLLDKSLKKVTLNVETITKNILLHNRDLQTVCEINYNFFSSEVVFDYKLSSDTSKLMIYSTLYNYDTKTEVIEFFVYNNNFELLWRQSISIPYSESLSDKKQWYVDDKGNTYLLYAVDDKDNSTDRKAAPRNKYKLVALLDSGRIFRELSVGLPRRYITDIRFAVADSVDNVQNIGNVVCAGFYSNNNEMTIRGTFYFSWQPLTQMLPDLLTNDFDVSVLKQFMSERKAQKGKELYEYHLDKFITLNNGNVVLIAEQMFVSAYNYYSTYFNYNHLLVTCFSPNGTVRWVRKIPKQQGDADALGSFSSYSVLVSDSDLYLLYNDSPNNLFAKANDKVFNFDRFRESLFVYTKISDNGDIIKEAVFNIRNETMVPRPKIAKRLSDTEILVLAQGDKAHQFFKLSFVKLMP